MRNLSLIIPLHNSEKKLKDIFKHLSEVRSPRDIKLAEVIFVDSGSKDETLREVAKLSYVFPNLNASVITYKNKLSTKDAVEEGIKHSKSRLNLAVKANLLDLEPKLKRLSKKLSKQKKPYTPALSVIMPVYNEEKFLAESINSVLSQTFKEFELIIVDDASTDTTPDILRKFERKSRRIKVFRNERRMGTSFTLRRAIDFSVGEYITRMDANNIAVARRFEKQIMHLQRNSKIVASGAQCLLIDSKGKTVAESTFPSAHAQIYEYVYKLIPSLTPSLMIARKRLPNDFEFYLGSDASSEEVELLFKLLKYGRLEILPDVLLKHRLPEANMPTAPGKIAFLYTLLARIKAPFAYGYKPTLSGVASTLSQIVTMLILPKSVNSKLTEVVNKSVNLNPIIKKTLVRV